MKETYLILGSQGQLGKTLCTLPHTLGLPQVDITNKKQLEDIFFHYKPKVIINAAAYTDVEKAEDEKQQVMLVNGTSVGYLSDLCTQYDTLLIHISTDYVFDGTKGTPYVETDAVNPINVYGHSKLLGEQLVQCKKHSIIRTSWVYSPYGHNFVKTMLKLAQTKDEIKVVDNQYGSPTYTCDLAKAIMNIAAKYSTSGLFHLTGGPKTTWYDFAKEILKNHPIKVLPTDHYPTKAQRPQYSLLDCTKIKDVYGIEMQNWKASLKDCLGSR